MLSAYFAESNNTLTIYCPVNQYNSKQMAKSDILCKHQCTFFNNELFTKRYSKKNF